MVNNDSTVLSMITGGGIYKSCEMVNNDNQRRKRRKGN